jgi:AI-2 transport protein TqsA
MKTSRMLPLTLGILALIAVGAVLKLAQQVILPVVIAVLLSFILEPMVRALIRVRVPRIVAMLLVIFFIFGFFYLIGLFLYNSAQSFLSEYQDYIERMNTIFQDFNEKYLSRLNIPMDVFENINWADTVKQYIVSWSGSFFRFLMVFALIILFLFFLFLENPRFKYKLKQAYPLHTARRVAILMEHITRQISRYLGIKFLISAGTGILIYIALTIIGMEFALIWATIAFFLNFIPNIGSLISAVITILVSIIQFYPSAGSILAVAVSVIVIQLGMGNFADPLLQGERLNLSPFIILFSLLFWGWLWGIVGAIIAIPLTATIRIVCLNIDYLRPVGVLLGGKHRRRKKRSETDG